MDRVLHMKLVFMGTPDFSLPSMERLLDAGHEVAAVYTQPDRPRGRGLRIHPPPVKRLAQERGLSVAQPEKLKDPAVLDRFRSLAPDAIVVVAYGRILPESLLRIPRLGAVNLHASLLPRHRGAAPVAWTILRGDREAGVTTMQMDPGMDTGDILLQRACRVRPEETAGELSARLAVLGADLLAETLDRIAGGMLAGTPQDPSLATYAPRIRREDARLDWSVRAEEIARRIRAFHPDPGAFTYLRGRLVKVWRGRAVPSLPPEGREPPGLVVELRRGVAVVACGGGTRLWVEQVQPEGRTRMTLEAFARGRQLRAGDRFGNP